MDIRCDPFPSDVELGALWRAAWSAPGPASFQPVLQRSLCHFGAYGPEALIGFVNVAWDGGGHAFLLDTCVDPAFRHRGIATALVGRATRCARERGAKWLHVDFEPHLRQFYSQCGFFSTDAGLIRLA